jgi:hypothetical protein
MEEPPGYLLRIVSELGQGADWKWELRRLGGEAGSGNIYTSFE